MSHPCVVNHATHQDMTCIWMTRDGGSYLAVWRETVAAGRDGKGRAKMLIKLSVPLVTSHVFLKGLITVMPEGKATQKPDGWLDS